LAAALALSLSFATLFAGRVATVLRICVLQALTAALAAGVQGLQRQAASLCLAALLAALLNGLALPFALRRMIGRGTMSSSIGLRCGVFGSAAAAFALVAASIAALTAGEDGEPLALSLSVLLLGLLFLAFRSHPLVPALGLLSSQSGLVVAACAIPGLPPPVQLLAAVPLVPSLAIASMWLQGRNRLAVTSRCA
jgi:hydrogenase-4 component E